MTDTYEIVSSIRFAGADGKGVIELEAGTG